MQKDPNFRISVESVILNNGKALLVKRSPDCKVAPGVWNVPAGKVQLLEKTADAVIRETLEETGLRVIIKKQLEEEASHFFSGEEKVFRNIFTYLTESIDPEAEVKLNNEHTEYAWICKSDLSSSKYSSLSPKLLRVLESIL